MDNTQLYASERNRKKGPAPRSMMHKRNHTGHLMAGHSDHYIGRLAALANHPGTAAIQRMSKAEEEEKPVQRMGNGVIQLSKLGDDRKRIREARNKKMKFGFILFVIAANIAGGAYLFEDVDDLLSEPEQAELRDKVKEKRIQKEELRAQHQQNLAAQKNMKRQFNNKGRNFKGR